MHFNPDSYLLLHASLPSLSHTDLHRVCGLRFCRRGNKGEALTIFFYFQVRIQSGLGRQVGRIKPQPQLWTLLYLPPSLAKGDLNRVLNLNQWQTDNQSRRCESKQISATVNLQKTKWCCFVKSGKGNTEDLLFPCHFSVFRLGSISMPLSSLTTKIKISVFFTVSKFLRNSGAFP